MYIVCSDQLLHDWFENNDFRINVIGDLRIDVFDGEKVTTYTKLNYIEDIDVSLFEFLVDNDIRFEWYD